MIKLGVVQVYYSFAYGSLHSFTETHHHIGKAILSFLPKGLAGKINKWIREDKFWYLLGMTAKKTQVRAFGGTANQWVSLTCNDLRETTASCYVFNTSIMLCMVTGIINDMQLFELLLKDYAKEFKAYNKVSGVVIFRRKMVNDFLGNALSLRLRYLVSDARNKVEVKVDGLVRSEMPKHIARNVRTNRPRLESKEIAGKAPKKQAASKGPRMPTGKLVSQKQIPKPITSKPKPLADLEVVYG